MCSSDLQPIFKSTFTTFDTPSWPWTLWLPYDRTQQCNIKLPFCQFPSNLVICTATSRGHLPVDVLVTSLSIQIQDIPDATFHNILRYYCALLPSDRRSYISACPNYYVNHWLQKPKNNPKVLIWWEACLELWVGRPQIVDPSYVPFIFKGFVSLTGKTENQRTENQQIENQRRSYGKQAQHGT